MPSSVASTADSSKSYVLSCDAAEPSAYALRYPAVKQQKDTDSKRQATLARDSAVKVIDFMLKNPARNSEIWNFVEQLMKQDEAADPSECWSSQYRRIWRIPTEWWAQWLGNHGGDDLPATTVQKVYSKDERAVKAIALFVCCLSSNTKLPEVLLRKQLASRVFAKLATKHKRWEIVGKAVNVTTGVINWEKLSPYKVVWGEDNCADAVEHINGSKVEIARGLRFSKDFKIRDPASDRDCAAVGAGDTKMVLCKFFPAGQGPHLCMEPEDGSSLLAMGEAEDKEHNEELQRARAGQLENVVECTATPEKAQVKRAGLEKARAAMRAKRSKVEVGVS